MRPATTFAAPVLALAAALTPVWAQNAASPAQTNAEALQNREQIDRRRNQKIERLQHEDGGSRIDELRVGGQTERISVQPKAAVPAYEVDAAPLSRSRPADSREGLSSAGGQRRWSVLSF